jgi:hypothetical protein
MFVTNMHLRCTKVTEDTVISTYKPQPRYDGENCVSAVLDIWVPIFMASVLVSSCFTAGLELFVIPKLVPYCFQRRHRSFLARNCLSGLHFLTRRLSEVAAAKHSSIVGASGKDSADVGKTLIEHLFIPVADLDSIARGLVERAVGQLAFTLLVAVTIGLAAPFVGAACVVAAVVQLIHHLHVLRFVADFADTGPSRTLPNVALCNIVPAGCGATILLSALVFWSWASIDYLNTGFMFLGSFVIILTAFTLVYLYWSSTKHRAATNRQERSEPIRQRLLIVRSSADDDLRTDTSSVM